MPIILDQLNTQVMAKSYDAKFFNKKLTGRGKKSGIINETKNPAFIDPTTNTTNDNIVTKKKKYANGQTTVHFIPLNTIIYDMWDYMTDCPIPNIADMHHIGMDKHHDIYIQMKPHTLIFEETEDDSGKTTRKLTPSYQVDLYLVTPNETTAEQTGGVTTAVKNAHSKYLTEFTCNPMRIYDSWSDKLIKSGANIKPDEIKKYMDNYNLYDGICQRSKEWQETIHETLEPLFENVAKRAYKNGTPNKNDLNMFVHQLRYLENYNIPLDIYRSIYTLLNKYFKPAETATLCKQNLNLLLSDTLNSLHNSKAQLTKMPVNPNNPMDLSKYSPIQQQPITTTEPLVLVQSGAGTGKCLSMSTPILTPTGWTTMGALKVGDQVIGSNGKPCRVTAIHEQGLKPGYHLTFRDGSEVDACGEHLWTIIVKDGKHEDGRRVTINTERWINSYYKTHGFLPVVEPVEYSYGEKDLPLDPYFLGALIADASLGGTGLIDYRKSNVDVINEVNKAAAKSGYTMLETTEKNATARRWKFEHTNNERNYNVLKRVIKDLGLNVKSREKFIPEIYKTASITQRKALLNGLFDGDGDIRSGRTYARFNTASDQMAEDVLQLLWSLGLSATKQKQKNKKGDYWSVNLLDGSWDPFIASEYTGKAKGSIRPMRRSLVKAEPIDPVPMRCIEVDAEDKLYVTKDFLVTHNSTTIKGRINYMIAAGVDPKDITVLSFTNAAANHILDICPDIHSMTIARMIHMIYTENFKNHELSTPETIINSIDIYYQHDQIAKDFQKKMYDIVRNEPNAFTNMNNFVEYHYDDIINILNRIGQTCLEMEIIICYQQIDNFIEPPEVQSKYLIIDEVQDNSVFEFIYSLKYVDKHKQSLFIVGEDCNRPHETLLMRESDTVSHILCNTQISPRCPGNRDRQQHG